MKTAADHAAVIRQAIEYGATMDNRLTDKVIEEAYAGVAALLSELEAATKAIEFFLKATGMTKVDLEAILKTGGENV